MTDKPLVTRDLLPLGSAAAMDLLYALDDRFQSGTVEPDVDRPVARLLGADTVWVTGDAAFDRFRTARPEIVRDVVLARRRWRRAAVRTASRWPTCPDISMIDEQSVSDPRIGDAVAARRARRRRRRRARRAGQGRRRRSSPAAATASSTPLPPGCSTAASWSATPARSRRTTPTAASRGHRHRHQPRPGAPLARLAGRRRLHRGRRSRLRRTCCVTIPPTSASPCSATTTRRRPSPSRTARCGPGRRRTASRSPTARRTAPSWPSTAIRRRRGASPTGPIRSASRFGLDIDEPIDHLTLQQPEGSAAVRHIGHGLARRRRPPADLGRARRPRRSSPTASASTSSRRAGRAP